MKINPLALTKSREYLGLSLEEAATILGYKKEKLALWERTEEGQRQLFEAKEHPTYKQLTHIAKKYCRNIYNFYAEEWDEQDFKIDFRIRKQPKSIDNIDYKKSYYLKKELLTTSGYISIFETLSEDNPIFFNKQEQFFLKVREAINYLKQQKQQNIFSFILKTLENVFPNLLVFQTNQHSNVDKSINGVSFTKKDCKNKAILINHQQSNHSKAFTLLHELYHLAIGEKDTFFLTKDNIEEKCNQFASEILLPEEVFQNYCQNKKEWNKEKIEKASFILNVSRAHFATRLLKARKISQEFYAPLKKAYDREYELQKLKEKEEKELYKLQTGEYPKIKIPYKIQLKSRMGGNYIHTIYDAYAENELTLYKAMKFLGIKKYDTFTKMGNF